MVNTTCCNCSSNICITRNNRSRTRLRPLRSSIRPARALCRGRSRAERAARARGKSESWVMSLLPPSSAQVHCAMPVERNHRSLVLSIRKSSSAALLCLWPAVDCHVDGACGKGRTVSPTRALQSSFRIGASIEGVAPARAGVGSLSHA